MTPWADRPWAARAATVSWRTGTSLYVAVTTLRGPRTDDLPLVLVQGLQFGAVLLAFIGLVVLTRPKLRTVSRPLAVFGLAVGCYLVVAAISGLTSVAPAQTLSQVAISALLLVTIGWNALTRWARSPAALRSDLAWTVLLAVAAQAVGLALLPIAPEEVVSSGAERFTGVFANANFCGIVSALGIALAVYLMVGARGRARVLLAVALVPLGATLYLSGSRTAAVGAVLAAGLTLAIARRRLLARALLGATAVAIAVAVLLVPVAALRGPNILDGGSPAPIPTPAATSEPSTSDPGPTASGAPAPSASPTPADAVDPIDTINVQSSGRLQLYMQAFDAWRAAPVLGHGFRTSAVVLGGLEAHNVLLGVLVETGVAGLLPFAAVLVAFVVLLRSRRVDLLLLGPVLVAIVVEFTTSSLFGWGGPVALTLWLTFLAPFFGRPRRRLEVTR